MIFTVEVLITYKESVLEPQGQAIMLSYENSNFVDAHSCIKKIRVGKYIQLQVDVSSEEEAIIKSKEITNSLLHNPVMEKYEINLVSNH